MSWRQRHAAAPNPILAFLGCERIDIDEHVPVGRIAAKALERRRAPNAPGIGGISPGIEQAGRSAKPSIRLRSKASRCDGQLGQDEYRNTLALRPGDWRQVPCAAIGG